MRASRIAQMRRDRRVYCAAAKPDRGSQWPNSEVSQLTRYQTQSGGSNPGSEEHDNNAQVPPSRDSKGPGFDSPMEASMSLSKR